MPGLSAGRSNGLRTCLPGFHIQMADRADIRGCRFKIFLWVRSFTDAPGMPNHNSCTTPGEGFPSSEEPEAVSVSMTPHRKLRMGRIMFMAGDSFPATTTAGTRATFQKRRHSRGASWSWPPSFWRLELLLQIIQPIRNARTPSPATLRGVEMPLSSVWAGGPSAAGVSWA